MKILNFGSCNVDHVYSLDHIVAVGETETTEKLELFPGGKGLNQSIAVAKAGAEIYHAGCIGEDGDLLRNILLENKVDVSYLKKVDGKNGHAIIQVSARGENSIFLYPGSNEKVTKDFIDTVLAHFGKDDILLLQNEISNVDYIVEKAHEKGMCIILNPSPIDERIERIDFKKLSYIIINEVEAAALSGCESPEEALAHFKREHPHLKVVLTLGGKGSVYADDSRELYQSAFAVEVVDTTAAGDTFTGYFAAGLAEGTDVPAILRLASAAAAITVSRMGAAPSIPRREEVLAALTELKENAVNGKSERLSKQIELYVRRNIKNATLKGLAEDMGYSTVYTGSLVKRLMGMSFSKVLQDRRCRTAAQMLMETDRSVQEIIDEVGYENESFFRKIFQEKYGKNPLEFRKRGQKR